MLDFLKELTRRKVWLFGVIYLGLAWVLLQVAALLESTLELPNWIDQSALVLLVIGFPMVLLLAWAQESAAKKSGPSSVITEDKGDIKPGFSVAVLAFNNLSDERELDWIADGLAEDILTRLGTVHFLTVTARNSSFAFKGESPDLRKVGEELGVRFVVEGSVRVVGDDLRVTAQLIDTATGGHVWSDNYDYTRDAMKTMQDEAVTNIASEVLAIVLNAEIDRLIELKSESLSVVEIVGLCWGKGIRYPTAQGTSEAIDLMKVGLTRFPDSAELHAELAFYCCSMGLTYDRDNRAALLKDAEHHLAQAIRIAPRAQTTL